MAQYKGRLQGPRLPLSTVTIYIEDGRFRIMAGHTPVGSWPLERVVAERVSIYRFDVTVEKEEPLQFMPDDPTGFSESVGAFIDLTEAKGRFGLAARIRAANG